ncbi:phosphotransferase [Brevibacillus laterosporus]
MSQYDQLFPLFYEYDMHVQTIELVKAPGVFKGTTSNGCYSCKKTAAPATRLLYVSGVLRDLEQRGWDGAIPLLYTKIDEPYVKHGEEIYYVSEWEESVSISKANLSNWASGTVVRLAEFHQLTQNYRIEDPKQVEPLVDALINRWQSWLRQLAMFRDLANERDYASPFDVVFLANHAFIADTANQALENLRIWRRRHETSNQFRLSLIHGYPHPSHTVMNENGRIRLLNFDRTVFDTPVRDITMMLRNYFQVGGKVKQQLIFLNSTARCSPSARRDFATTIFFTISREDHA